MPRGAARLFLVCWVFFFSLRIYCRSFHPDCFTNSTPPFVGWEVKVLQSRNLLKVMSGGLVDEQGGGLAAPSSGRLTLVLPQGLGWGRAPLWLPTSPMPLDSLLGTASPYFASKTGGFCIGCAPKVSLLSLRLKYNCRFVEESLETGLSELGGCVLPRQQPELRFSAAAQELESTRTWSEEALVLAVPCSDTVNP